MNRWCCRASITFVGLSVAACAGSDVGTAPEIDEVLPPTLEAVQLESSTVVIGGPAVGYTVILTNPGPNPARGLSIHVRLEQGAATREVSQAPVECGSGTGTLPAGSSCASDLAFTASNDVAGDGTLDAGPAMVWLELVAGTGDQAVVVSVQSLPVTLVVAPSGSGTATIDASIGPDEWGDAIAFPLVVNWPSGVTAAGELLVMNDAHNLYVAVRLYGDARALTWSSVMEFDLDGGDGAREQGDDALVVNWWPTSVPHTQLHDNVATGPCCSVSDQSLGGTIDGGAAHFVTANEAIAEYWHPLAGTDLGHDMQLSSGDVISFVYFNRLLLPIADTRLPPEWVRIH